MNRRHKANPSFSSTLLDEIYRSIDEVEERKKEDSKKRTAVKGGIQCGEKVTCLRRNKVEDWMLEKKKTSEKVHFNWSSSPSESSSGEFTDNRPKPIRTGNPANPVRSQKLEYCEKEKSFSKTKSRTMKIYGDLKKVKQPISPGGRLATFLNSLFTTGTPKKTKISSSTGGLSDEMTSHNNPRSKSSCTSTCSSASSFSRSCLSNSSLREKPINGSKRTVKFYPVTVILGQDSDTEYKNEMRNMISEEIKVRIMEKNRRVEEAARVLLKNYQKAEYEYFNVEDTRKKIEKNINDNDDEDDDAASYASSDLFELDHLSTVEELPVYETTQLRKNVAIANGLMSEKIC